MGLFATHRAIKRIENRQGELLERIHRLETANKQLGLEWEELYDKVRHQMSRMARRAKVDTPPNGEDLDPNPDAGGDGGIDPISAKILARRGIRRQAE